ncbi:MAG TPA: DinB family protein [Ktedonobacteraceae bacterium]|nr:DinB family protein [Ktedonobacteraceae bacterium]
MTRQWIIWHVIEHDLHHGGEISLILGTHGLTGIAIEASRYQKLRPRHPISQKA